MKFLWYNINSEEEKEMKNVNLNFIYDELLHPLVGKQIIAKQQETSE